MNQPRIGQTLAIHRFDKAIKAVERVDFDVPFVQAEGEFVHIAVEMLRAGVVVDAVHPALHYRPHALDTVRPGIAPNVLARAVVDRFMAKEDRRDTRVGCRLIRHQCGTNFDAIENGGLNRLFVCIGYGHGDGATAALTKAEYSRLSDRTATSAELLRPVLVLFLASEERFVDFDHALQLLQFAAASLAETVKHEPCGFLGDTNFFGYLHGRYAFAGRHKQVHRVNPLVQRDVRPLENRACTDGEIQLALVAAVEALALAGGDVILTAARWADGAFRPQTAFEVHPRRGFVGEHLKELKGADRALAHGGNPWRGCVPSPGYQSDAPLTSRKARRSLLPFAASGNRNFIGSCSALLIIGTKGCTLGFVAGATHIFPRPRRAKVGNPNRRFAESLDRRFGCIEGCRRRCLVEPFYRKAAQSVHHFVNRSIGPFDAVVALGAERSCHAVVPAGGYYLHNVGNAADGGSLSCLGRYQVNLSGRCKASKTGVGAKSNRKSGFRKLRDLCHLVLLVWLIATKDKVLESRNLVKSYFQQKGLKYVIPKIMGNDNHEAIARLLEDIDEHLLDDGPVDLKVALNKKAQESEDKFMAEFRAHCTKNIAGLVHVRKPDKTDECHFCGCFIPSEEELHRQWDRAIPLDGVVKLPAIERGRRNEGDADAMPDPSLGGFMESDASLRKRALAYHVNQQPDVVVTAIPPFDPPSVPSITGNHIQVSIERVKETPYSIRVNSAFVEAVSRRLGSQDWSWPAKVSICEEVIAEYLAIRSRDGK